MINAQRNDQAIGLPRNYMRACILLLLSEAPSHGYELMDGMQELGHGNADPGGLYRALRAMEQEGLVASWWEESPSGPARRSYRLAEDGRAALDGFGSGLRDIARSLQDYLSRFVALSVQQASDQS